MKEGLLIGLAVGDALGTTLEFKDRDDYTHITDMIGGGPFRLKPGEWTDDTSMALALAETLVNNGADTIDLLSNFSRWYKKGQFSHNNRCFDIGSTTIQALDKFIKSRGTLETPASTHFMDSGNGGIMRLSPAVMAASSRDRAVELSVWQSRTTHATPECLKIAEKMGGDLWDLSNGVMPNHVQYFKDRTRDEIESTGYVIHTYEAAWWAILNTTTFRDALLLAVNLGEDADTVGAVCGQLAAAKYGFQAIPSEWVERIAWKERIMQYERDLLSLHL